MQRRRAREDAREGKLLAQREVDGGGWGVWRRLRVLLLLLLPGVWCWEHVGLLVLMWWQRVGWLLVGWVGGCVPLLLLLLGLLGCHRLLNLLPLRASTRETRKCLRLSCVLTASASGFRARRLSNRQQPSP